MSIQWLRPTKAELDRGILAKRVTVCYCDTSKDKHSAEKGKLMAVNWYGGYDIEIVGENGKKKKVHVPKTPAVINYTEDMLAKLWRKHPELMPPFVKVE